MADLSTDDSINEIAANVAGVKLRPFQQAAIKAVLGGQDVFVAVPTGSGKTMCYSLLPAIVDKVRQPAKSPSMIVVVSPLLALMDNQVKELSNLNIRATHLGSNQTTSTAAQVLEGDWQVVLITPERLTEIRPLLRKFKEKLVAIVVDEAHCINTWGTDDFRPSFQKLGQLRAITPDTPVMALTATANQITVVKICDVLYMQSPKKIQIKSNRCNISYSVMEIANGDLSVFDKYVCLVKDPSVVCPKVVVYCRTIDVVTNVWEYFRPHVPHVHTEFCPVSMFHGATAEANKVYVLSEFPKPDSRVRIVIATVAFGMGINVKDIKTVINYGIPLSLEDFVQESGRAGRDGAGAESILYHSRALQGRGTHAAMLEYCSKDVGCRRRYLADYFRLSHFDEFEAPEAKSASPCCDLCGTQQVEVEVIPFENDGQDVFVSDTFFLLL